jgi:hypothetical protein
MLYMIDMGSAGGGHDKDLSIVRQPLTCVTPS